MSIDDARSLSELSTDTPLSPADDEKVDPELVAHLRETIANLEREVAATKQRHVDEIAYISARLADAADSNELCSVYDNTIASINASDRVTVPLGAREVDQTLHVQGTVTFTIDRHYDVNLPIGSGPDSDLARERVEALLRAVGLNTLARHSGGEMTDICVNRITY